MALIQLYEPVTFDENVAIIRLADKGETFENGELCYITGTVHKIHRFKLDFLALNIFRTKYVHGGGG